MAAAGPVVGRAAEPAWVPAVAVVLREAAVAARAAVGPVARALVVEPAQRDRAAVELSAAQAAASVVQAAPSAADQPERARAAARRVGPVPAVPRKSVRVGPANAAGRIVVIGAARSVAAATGSRIVAIVPIAGIVPTGVIAEAGPIATDAAMHGASAAAGPSVGSAAVAATVRRAAPMVVSAPRSAASSARACSAGASRASPPAPSR